MLFFYKRHLCNVDASGKPHQESSEPTATSKLPFPKDATDSLELLESDDTVYFTMNGPSEFTVVGSLKTWSVIDELHKISVPTLILNGEFDEARDRYAFFLPPFSHFTSALLVQHIPKVISSSLPQSPLHLCLYWTCHPQSLSQHPTLQPISSILIHPTLSLHIPFPSLRPTSLPLHPTSLSKQNY